MFRNIPYAVDVNFTKIGAGKDDFARAKKMMNRWAHFQLGWSEVDESTGSAPGSDVCVCARVFGVWIRNPLKVVYNETSEGEARGGGRGRGSGKNGTAGGAGAGNGRCVERFAFAHGCLGGHLLAGEESFVLERMEDDSVWYGVSTFSRPAHVLSFVGYPAVRVLQWKFARDSMRAMRVRLDRA